MLENGSLTRVTTGFGVFTFGEEYTRLFLFVSLFFLYGPSVHKTSNQNTNVDERAWRLASGVGWGKGVCNTSSRAAQ